MRRWLAVVVVALVAAGALLAATRDEEPTGPTWQLLQLNLCGNANSTPTGCRGGDHDPGRWIAEVAAAVARREPSVVTVNEACRGQLDGLLTALDERGWPMAAHFGATVTDPGLACIGAKEYGNAVLVRGDVRGERRNHVIGSADSPEHPFERRAMTCATVVPDAAPRAMVACATHVIPVDFGPAEHDRQLERIAEVLDDERATGLPVLLGGDFNTRPHLVDAALGTADLRDVPAGARAPATYHGKKFDYLLTTDDLGERRRLRAFSVPGSDHRGLVLELSAEDERR